MSEKALVWIVVFLLSFVFWVLLYKTLTGHGLRLILGP